MSKEAEPTFSTDQSDGQEAILTSLNALTEVKAYTLTADELRELKAAQYALRYLSPEFDTSKQASDAYE